MIDQGNASAWTCWCYEFADLYLRECCQLTSQSSGRLTSANTQNAEVSGQPCDKQGCFRMCLWLLFQPFSFLSWFSSFTVVFLIFLETSLCAAREFESHTSTDYQEPPELFFFFLFFFFCCWKLDMNSDSHLKTQSMFNQCFVIVMPFVSNRIAPVVLHVLDYTYKRTRQRRYSTDSKSLHRQSMCSKRVLWKEGSKSHKPGSKMNTLPHLPVYSSPSSSTPYGRLLRRALQNVPCKHAQAKFA